MTSPSEDRIVFALDHPYVAGELAHLPEGRDNLCHGPCNLREGILYRSCPRHSAMLIGWTPDPKPIRCGQCGEYVTTVENNRGGHSSVCGCVTMTRWVPR
ncbi:hypothetical protein [Gordonia soli]|uniref:Uncharacterized protein n=1 Tax=Gordonia soli NBRC 108243 TaxID=1223545 RepID=M0QF26_9ACTN|nr:hypothetical protein [Gordonia soli]GAC67059.1 hypothetical protein GS4_05_02720 [Gordonia soli NBRC 108243]